MRRRAKGPDILFRGNAHEPLFVDMSVLGKSLQKAIDEAGLRPITYIDGRHRWSLKEHRLESVMPHDPSTTQVVKFDLGELTFNWFPPSRLIGRWKANLYCNFRAAKGVSLCDAERMFKCFIVHLRWFWGELNVFGITIRPTFAGTNAHYLEVPKPGYLTYLGSEYVECLGGEEKLRATPLADVTSLGDGLLLSLASATPDEFVVKQCNTVDYLGENLFMSSGRSKPIHHQLFWNEAEMGFFR